jgi:hypothetical protein
VKRVIRRAIHTIADRSAETLRPPAYIPVYIETAFQPFLQKALDHRGLCPYQGGERRGGRVVEGAPLLREYTGNGIEGSNPFFSAILP